MPHSPEIGLPILPVGFRDAGIDISAGEQKTMSTAGSDFAPNLVDQGFSGGHAVFAVFVLPESSMLVVRVQNGESKGGRNTFIFVLGIQCD